MFLSPVCYDEGFDRLSLDRWQFEINLKILNLAGVIDLTSALCERTYTYTTLLQCVTMVTVDSGSDKLSN